MAGPTVALARTVHYTATSLDGFIADADSSLQWLFDVPRADEDAAGSWEELIGDVRPVHAEALEAAAGKDVWIVGGGDLVGQFHDAGLLDRVVVSVAPVTLGAGAPLLPRRVEGMHLVDVRQEGEMVRLTYDVRR